MIVFFPRRAALVALLFSLAGCMSAQNGGTPADPTKDTGIVVPDNGGAPSDTVTPVDTNEPEDTFQCPNPVGSKPFFAECEYDCECATGLCYDEAFNGPDFNFCTRECDFDCEVGPNDGTQQNFCLLFSPVHVEKYGLTIDNICAPRCSKVDECKELSSKYDACGTESGWTVWEEKYLGVATCIISSAFE
jgi:hypothetical protein